jgi:hypothetical protein
MRSHIQASAWCWRRAVQPAIRGLQAARNRCTAAPEGVDALPQQGTDLDRLRVPDGVVVVGVIRVAVQAKQPQADDVIWACARVAAAGIDFRLVDDHQVGELHHTLLDGLQVVAGVGQLQQARTCRSSPKRRFRSAPPPRSRRSPRRSRRLHTPASLRAFFRPRRPACRWRGWGGCRPFRARRAAPCASCRPGWSRPTRCWTGPPPVPPRGGPVRSGTDPASSMKVLLPTPGTPLMPRRKAPPPPPPCRCAATSAVSNSSACTRWSARVDSSKVIALAMARRCARPR